MKIRRHLQLVEKKKSKLDLVLIAAALIGVVGAVWVLALI